MKHGFTIIELLVVVAITAMISAFAISYSKTSQRQLALFVEEQKIAGLIFRAKSLAVATYNSPSPNRCGYGFLIDYTAGTYSLFTYEAPTVKNCSGISSVPADYRNILETYTPAPHIVINNSKSDSLVLVLFVPPAPSVLVSVENDGSQSDSPAKIYLGTDDGLSSDVITVGLAGQIDF